MRPKTRYERFSLRGKLTEWKRAAKGAVAPQAVTFSLRGKLTEWKRSRLNKSINATWTFPLRGKLIEWKRDNLNKEQRRINVCFSSSGETNRMET